MCIYYRQSDLIYEKREHVISAAIGGIQTLPIGLVSDQFNNDFSRIEQDLYRHGILSMARTMVGPGKRGSLSASKATKSKVHVVVDAQKEGNYGLAYTQSGRAKQIEIPHLSLNLTTRIQTFNCDKSLEPDAIEVLRIFKERALKPECLKIKWVTDDHLPEDHVLIGIADNIEENFNCFVFKNSRNVLGFNLENIRSIAEGMKFQDDPEHLKYMPRVFDGFQYKIEHERVWGKTAINVLALLTSGSFVNRTSFQLIKDWIVDGAEFHGKANDTSAHVFTIGGIPIPQDAHLVIISKTENKLIAKVIFYAHFGMDLILADDFSDPFPTNGFICDWKNRKEYQLNEFIATWIHEQENK